jgi:hypothetical protein
MLLKFQRKNLVETSSSSCDSDNEPKKDAPSLMENKNPMIRLAYFGRIKRMVTSYRHSNLKTFDRRLLRGLFLKNLKDFDEDYNDMMANQSLLARLRGALQPISSTTSLRGVV